MKICVSATTNSLDAPVDPRFGRCPYFVIVDSETVQYEAILNPALHHNRALSRERRSEGDNRYVE